MLKLVGLTGGIGTGKSTVARMIRDMGVPVIDADVLARQIVEPGQPAFLEIKAAWPQVVNAKGEIDRKKLASQVFAHASERKRLEDITHPRIMQMVQDQSDQLFRKGYRLAFLDAALLVETGLHRHLGGLVVVTASEAQQVSRVMAREGCTPSQARARMRAQLPMEDKRRVATAIIDNSGDEAATRTQIQDLVRKLLKAR
jgi:dephospho-CoA kinase